MNKFAQMFGNLNINKATELFGTAKGLFNKPSRQNEDAAAAASAAAAAEEEKKKKEQTTMYVVIGVVALFMLKKFKMI